jgi:hypothetical protein
MRHLIGIDNLMWGNDYPHIEGCWPRSRQWIARSFHGCPEKEMRIILGETAARLYGFDPATLGERALSVGPELDDVVRGQGPSEDFLKSRHESRVNRSPLWVMGGSRPSAGDGSEDRLRYRR